MALIAVIVLAAACGGDDEDSPDPTTEATATTDASATPAPNAEAIAAARAYLSSEGVDGNQGDLTNPLSCTEINEDAEGDFCVHDGFSVFAPGLVILVVGDSENPDERAWELRLEPNDEEWTVISAEPFGSTE
jgi:hypothetical protein